MDWMRQPKLSEFIIIRGSTERVPVRWFRAPAGAEFFPGWHHFGNCDWFPEDDRVDIGDYNLRPRKFQLIGGEPKYSGKSFCGPADWFANGVPAEATPLPRERNHVPECCLPAKCFKLRITGFTHCPVLT